MTTTNFNLDACRNELAREILATDSAEVLEKVRRAFRRAAKAKAEAEQEEAKAQAEQTAQAWPCIGPHTREEMLTRIAESEADEAAGRMYTTDEVRQHLEQQIPGLWK